MFKVPANGRFSFFSLCPQTQHPIIQQPSSQHSAHPYRTTYTRTASVGRAERAIGIPHYSASLLSLKICGMLLWWRAGTHLCCCPNVCQVSRPAAALLASLSIDMSSPLSVVVHRWNAGTSAPRRAPAANIHWPPGGASPAAHTPAHVFVVVAVLFVVVFVIVVVLLFRSQRAEEDWRQEEVSLQLPGCLHGDQPGGDGHVRRHVLRVLHCHHCPVK